MMSACVPAGEVTRHPLGGRGSSLPSGRSQVRLGLQFPPKYTKRYPKKMMMMNNRQSLFAIAGLLCIAAYSFSCGWFAGIEEGMVIRDRDWAACEGRRAADETCAPLGNTTF